MPAPCIKTTLSSNLGGGCPQVVGVEKDATLLAHSSLNRAALTYDAGNPFIVTELTKTAVGRKVTVEGDMPFSDMAVNGTMGTFVQLFESTFGFPILENSPAAAKQIAELSNDHYLAIVQFKGYDAAKKNKYGIIGLQKGLMFSAGNMANDSQENFGWRVVLTETEGLHPMFFLWKTDEATTDALVAGLLT